MIGTKKGALLSTVLGVLAAGVLTACGASSNSTGTQSKAQTAACVSRAQALVKKAEAPVPFRVPPRLDLNKLRGKDVWMVTGSDDPFVTEIANGFKQAAKAGGAVPHVVLTNGTSNAMVQGMTEAVAQHAAGIAIQGVNPTLVSAQAYAAKRAGIPIVDNDGVGDPYSPLGPEWARVGNDFGLDSRKLVAWVLAHTGCRADIAHITAQGFDVLKPMATQAVAEVKDLCPKTCKISVSYFDISKQATTVPTLVQSVLRRDPNINAIYPAYDAAVPDVEPAMRQAGVSKVKIVSHDGEANNLNQIRSGGGLQAADMAYPPTAFIGWAIFDQLGRGVTGEKPFPWVPLPMRLVDDTNAGKSNAELFPAYQNFEAKFINAWRTGK